MSLSIFGFSLYFFNALVYNTKDRGMVNMLVLDARFLRTDSKYIFNSQKRRNFEQIQ